METLWKFILSLGLAILTVSCGSENEKDFADRMSEEHQGDTPVKNASSELDQSRHIQGKQVQYATINGNKITGYLAKPDSVDEELPGLIVIHEWWGLNDNIRMMTEKLAAEGYTALAVDLYSGKVATTPDSAKAYMQSVDQPQGIENLTQAYNYLEQQQKAPKVGTIGWCFGGGWSLQTALAHPDKIDATVIYYGRLVTDASKLEKLHMPVLGFFGAEDGGIPPKTVNAFEAALDEAGVSNSIHIYEGAGHAFANPSGTRYVKKAAEDAWKKTTRFLNKNL